MPVFARRVALPSIIPSCWRPRCDDVHLLRIATLPAIAWPVGAKAQAFPTKPVTIIVPFSAGGPLDTLCRILAEHMQGTLGQSVVIEEVTGAGGAIGITRVARSPADGLHASSPATRARTSRSAPCSRSPSTCCGTSRRSRCSPPTSQLILVRKSLEVANLRELLAWIRANPGKVTDGGGGYGTVAHTSALYFQQLSGTTIQFVPYRGAAAALQDLLAGQIDMMIDQPSNSLPHVQAGKVRRSPSPRRPGWRPHRTSPRPTKRACRVSTRRSGRRCGCRAEHPTR